MAAKRPNKNRSANSRPSKQVQNDIEITDMNPKEVPYSNPPGFRYVRAIVTFEDGEEVEGIHLLATDHIERIKASK